MVLCLFVWNAAAIGAEQTEQGGTAVLKYDFVGAAYLAGLDGVVVTGIHGLVGVIKVGDTTATLTVHHDVPDVDFTALGKVSDNEVMIGSSTGHVYSFDGSKLTEVATLSEHDDPIMDIVAAGGHIWVVGARGIVAHSKDGHTWESIEIRDVIQPPMTIPPFELKPEETLDWYFGASNISSDSFKIEASVNGAPAVADENYVMYADEGFLQASTAFDADPPVTVSFTFDPGPAFRPGDVSWNTVMYDGKNVTIAGEFGLILQSADDGKTWTRRNGTMTPSEPEPPYWLASARNSDVMMISGAAGVSTTSTDGGVTWQENPQLGREGIFGITLLPSGQPLIAGAVGLIGVLEGEEWLRADRTKLKLLSWLKPAVALPDGSSLVLGGRGTAIRFRDHDWTRVPIAAE